MGYAGFDANRAFRRFLEAERVPFTDFTRNDNQPREVADRKWFDFLIPRGNCSGLIVEVKGRTMSAGRLTPSAAWVKEEDVTSLLDWRSAQFPKHRAVFAFAFGSSTTIDGYATTVAAYDLQIVVLGIDVEDYRAAMQPRSGSWGTVKLPKAEFARIARPFAHFL